MGGNSREDLLLSAGAWRDEAKSVWRWHAPVGHSGTATEEYIHEAADTDFQALLAKIYYEIQRANQQSYDMFECGTCGYSESQTSRSHFRGTFQRRLQNMHGTTPEPPEPPEPPMEAVREFIGKDVCPECLKTFLRMAVPKMQKKE